MNALRWICMIGSLLLLNPALGWTQEAKPSFTFQDAEDATANGNALTIGGYTSIGLAVTISATATVTFEANMLNDGTFSSVRCTATSSGVSSSTATSTGHYQCNVAGFYQFRARISAYTSGDITVTGQLTTATFSDAMVTIAGAGTADGFGANTAAAPSRSEGSAGSFSFDLAGNARVTLGTLIAGEDQTNNLIRTSGGAVRQTTVVSGVTTNTTSAATTVFTGAKTFYGQVVCSSGACTQTQAIYGDIDNDAANGILLCTLTLSATTRDQAACAVSTAAWSYYYVVTTATSGTSATGAVYAMY